MRVPRGGDDEEEVGDASREATAAGAAGRVVPQERGPPHGPRLVGCVACSGDLGTQQQQSRAEQRGKNERMGGAPSKGEEGFPLYLDDS